MTEDRSVYRGVAVRSPAMFKVFSVPATKRAEKDEVLKDDLVSRQSIAQRDADVLGFPGLGTLVLIEGDEKAVARAAQLFKGIAEELPPEKAAAVRQKIRDQEDDVAAGVGLIFG
jgi:hypothetical protein